MMAMKWSDKRDVNMSSAFHAMVSKQRQTRNALGGRKGYPSQCSGLTIIQFVLYYGLPTGLGNSIGKFFLHASVVHVF